MFVVRVPARAPHPAAAPTLAIAHARPTPKSFVRDVRCRKRTEARCLARSVTDQRLVEKAARLHPVAPHRALRDPQGLSRLLLGHPAEEAAFHHPSESLVEERKLIERLV